MRLEALMLRTWSYVKAERSEVEMKEKNLYGSNNLYTMLCVCVEYLDRVSGFIIQGRAGYLGFGRALG